MLKNRKILTFVLFWIILSECLCNEEFLKSICTDEILFVMPADNGTVMRVEATDRNIKLLECVVDRSIFLCPRLNKEIDFLLYTKKNPDIPYHLASKSRSIEKSPFDKHKLTVVLFHGWMSNSSTSLTNKIKDAFLQNHDFNIISVDWSRNSKILIYHLSEMYIHHTGRECINFFRFLINYGVSAKHVYFIGYGFGGHMAAYVANGVSKTGLIGRFTGLDISEPLMCSKTFERRSYMEDMKNVSCFVAAIHTSFLGKRLPFAHADFYPDRGINQKPCANKDNTEFSCSHVISIEYFIDSIANDNSHLGIKCKSFEDLEKNLCNSSSETVPDVIMGYNTPSTAHGVYYVPLNNKQKYMLDKHKESSKAVRNFSMNTRFMISTFLVIWCYCFVTFII